MYVAYAPEYRIENTETFNLANPYVPMSLTNIENYKKLLVNPDDVADAVYTVKAEKSDVLRKYVFQKYPYTFEKSKPSLYIFSSKSLCENTLILFMFTF